jgi:hypothetical protein
MTRDPKLLRDKLDEIEGRFFGAYFTQLDKNREYYHLNYGKRLTRDEGFTVLVPPTAARAIDEPADHILYNPKIRVPVRPTEADATKEQDIAERKRKFINAWWNQVTLRYNPIGDGRKPFLNEGKIAIRKTLRWDLIPKTPKKEDYSDDTNFRRAKDEYRRKIARLGRNEWLWEVELLDNRTVFEDPSSHRDPQYVFIKYKILAEEARNRWPEKVKNWDSYGDFDEIDYVEYWSRDEMDDEGEVKPGQFIQWIERDVVFDDVNPYPYIPVVIEDAGFGTNHRFTKPEEKFVGMTQHAFPIFEAEAIQMTSLQEVTKISAFPLIKSRNMAADKPIVMGPGAVIPLEGATNDPTAEDLEIMQWPSVPDSVLSMIEKTDRIANSTFKMNILGGIPQTGVDTATEADQNVRNATSKLSGPIAALERLVMRLTSQILIDVENVLEAPITVFGTGEKDQGEITLNPTDIAGYYHVSAEMRTSDEDAISQNKARFWMEATLRNPFLSYQTAMERGEISDEPQAEMMRRAAEDVFLSPEFTQIRVMTGAQSFGELATLMQQMQQGEVGGGPTPGVNAANSSPPVSTQAASIDQAQVDRNSTQGASQLRA